MTQVMDNTFTKENSLNQIDNQNIMELTGKLKAMESINDKFQKE